MDTPAALPDLPPLPSPPHVQLFLRDRPRARDFIWIITTDDSFLYDRLPFSVAPSTLP